MNPAPSSGRAGVGPPQPTSRLYVLAALGWPIYGPAGYRGVGTVTCRTRADAHSAASEIERTADCDGFGAGPVRPMLARVAGTRLLGEALAADGQRARMSQR